MSDLPLKDARVGPNKAKSLMVFLHGYGANGADLLSLAEVLGEHLPDVAFRAPDAPEPCRGAPMGFQWFPVPWLDGSSAVQMGQSLAASTALLHSYLDAVLTAEGLDEDRLILFGFSQGTMMALEAAFHRSAAIGGVVGFSGRLLSVRPIKHACKVLLLHGDQDGVVPFSDLAKAKVGLESMGVAPETFVMAGTGHGIDGPGLSRALTFLLGLTA